MKKRKTLKKFLNSPIRPLTLDSTEFLLLAFVAVALLTVLSWQLGLLPSILTNTLVLGTSTAR